MNALLIVAHGSRRPESNQEIRTLTRKIASVATGFELVNCAFLELAEPNIVQGGINLIEAGARSIRILPYFLVAGRHVVTDVPAEINKIIAQYPDIRISTEPYFGSSDAIVELILQGLTGEA